jgi:hypothetical protein
MIKPLKKAVSRQYRINVGIKAGHPGQADAAWQKKKRPATGPRGGGEAIRCWSSFYRLAPLWKSYLRIVVEVPLLSET